MKSWDVIIIGGGIIGLTLSLELRKAGASVLIVERGQPARESSHAAAGMLVGAGAETLPQLRSLAKASADMYPEFVHELQDESALDCDLRGHGTIYFPQAGEEVPDAERLSPEAIEKLEPALKPASQAAFLLNERVVDPRALCAAALKSAQHRDVTIASGSEVEHVLFSGDRVDGVKPVRPLTHRTSSSTVPVAGQPGFLPWNLPRVR